MVLTTPATSPAASAIAMGTSRLIVRARKAFHAERKNTPPGQTICVTPNTVLSQRNSEL